MKQYESYRPTTVPWLDNIPYHWNECRAKYLYKKESRPALESDEVVTCFRDGQVTLRKNRRISGFTESIKECGYQHIQQGDLVIHVMDAFAGAVGVSDSDGKGTPVYSVCTAIQDTNNYYFAYAIREMAKKGFIQSLYRGIRERSSDFRFDVFAAQILPVPPREEQDQIVHYLDWQTTKINQLIDAKKKQIQVLREYALSVCNELLTRGVDPTVIFKPTGSNWMEEIPAHWKISKIVKHFTIKKRIAGKEGYDVLSITQQGLKVKDISTNEGQMAANYSGYQFVYPGDFAMNHMDLVTGYIDISKHFGVTSPDYRVFVLDDTKKCFPEYYLHLFQLCYKRKIFYGYGRGAANQGRWRMPAVNFRSFEIPLPPYEEQKIISAKIQEINARIESACSKLESEIITLSEMKTRLISDVVTGQIDVRNIEVPDFKLVEETVDDTHVNVDVNIEGGE